MCPLLCRYHYNDPQTPKTPPVPPLQAPLWQNNLKTCLCHALCRYHYNVANTRVEQHVDKGNDDGLYISSVACCQELWALIMDAGTGFTAQVYNLSQQFLPKVGAGPRATGGSPGWLLACVYMPERALGIRLHVHAGRVVVLLECLLLYCACRCCPFACCFKHVHCHTCAVDHTP